MTSIRDFDERDNDLIVATHGRAFWVLDDIAPLRQLDATVAGSSAWLFRPDAAVLVPGGRRAPSPAVAPYIDPVDLAAGENPPSGAVIDYYLAKDAGAVSLDVLDAQGATVRHYSSTDKPRRAEPRHDGRARGVGRHARRAERGRRPAPVDVGPALGARRRKRRRRVLRRRRSVGAARDVHRSG